MLDDKVDFYGYPTVEGRELARTRLRCAAQAVAARVPHKYKTKMRAAKGAVRQLGHPGASSDDLGSLLELCAHARGAPSTYYQEVDVLGNWLLRELQDNRTPPLFEVTESESETSENDNKAERQPQMQKSKAENETDIARALCDIWRRAPVAARQERACV